MSTHLYTVKVIMGLSLNLSQAELITLLPNPLLLQHSQHCRSIPNAHAHLYHCSLVLIDRSFWMTLKT